MTCGQCGARMFLPCTSVEDQRVACGLCGWPTIVRGHRTGNAATFSEALREQQEPRRHRALPGLEISRLLGAHTELGDALNNVRPTEGLLERCYTALRKHGIAWRT